MGRPLVWAAAAFAAGILVADRRPADPAAVWGIAGGTYLLWVLTLIVSAGRPRHVGQVPGLAAVPVLLIFVALGHLAASLDPVAREAEAAAALEGRRVAAEGLVVSPVEGRSGRQRVLLRIARINGARAVVPFTAAATLPADPPLRYGDVVSVRGTLTLPPEGGNPGESSLRAALRRRGIVAFLQVPSHQPVRLVRRGAGSRPVAWALSLRERLVGPLLTLPGPYGSVLAGLLYGAQAGGDEENEEMEEIFRRAGLLHVLVVSGAQVGLLVAAMVALLGRLRLPSVMQALAAGGTVIVFATMVGWGPAVGRAAIMALVGLGAIGLRRDADGPSTLAMAALLWLAAHPDALFGLGFQLSFAATWGLLYLAPALVPPLRPRWFAEIVGATSGAQLAVLPLLAAVFQQVSLAAFPANLLVLPIVAVLVPAGFALSLIGSVLPGAAAFLVPAFLPPVRAIVSLARVFAVAPGAQVWLPPVAWWQAGGVYGLLWLLPRWHQRAAAAGFAAARWAGVLALAFSLALLSLRAVPPHLGETPLEVVVLDVGQGDAILLRGPSGRTMLVDGGGEVEVPGRASAGAASYRSARDSSDIGLRRVVPALRRLGVRRLDAVLLSHAHEDHVGGLPAVLQNFSVDLVLDPGVPHPSPSYARFLTLVQQRRIPYVLARRGQRLDLGGGTTVEILWPPEEEGATVSEDTVNARSVVARVAFGRVAALLTGDIEAETEGALLERGTMLESAVLKVAHHGSRTSTTPAFLAAVRPSVAVISVGRGNFFGHPHTQTLRALAERGIRVYRTDRDGAVILRTDGTGLSVRPQRQTARGVP